MPTLILSRTCSGFGTRAVHCRVFLDRELNPKTYSRLDAKAPRWFVYSDRPLEMTCYEPDSSSDKGEPFPAFDASNAGFQEAFFTRLYDAQAMVKTLKGFRAAWSKLTDKAGQPRTWRDSLRRLCTVTNVQKVEVDLSLWSLAFPQRALHGSELSERTYHRDDFFMVETLGDRPWAQRIAMANESNNEGGRHGSV